MTLILLAVSRKYSRYCVAGVDVKNGKMTRLITTNSDAHYAVSEEELRYPDGKLACKLDKVEVEVTDRSVSYYQTENYVLKKGVRWQKLGMASIQDVISIHPLNQPAIAFYDTKRKLHKDIFRTLEPRDICSLMLIQPQNTVLLIQESFDRRQALFDFHYKGQHYEPFPITDPDYCASIADKATGSYPMDNDPILLLSVGECFAQDQCHYKLAAGVFPCDPSSI
jgi:hypothetical protein